MDLPAFVQPFQRQIFEKLDPRDDAVIEELTEPLGPVEIVESIELLGEIDQLDARFGLDRAQDFGRIAVGEAQPNGSPLGGGGHRRSFRSARPRDARLRRGVAGAETVMFFDLGPG